MAVREKLLVATDSYRVSTRASELGVDAAISYSPCGEHEASVHPTEKQRETGASKSSAGFSIPSLHSFTQHSKQSKSH